MNSSVWSPAGTRLALGTTVCPRSAKNSMNRLRISDAERYGIAGWELAPHRISLECGAELVEVPVAVWSKGSWRLPVAGGGYFRVLPGPVIRRALVAIAASGRPPVVYCHPYEFNPDELSDYAGRAPRAMLLSQGLGRTGTARRVRDLLAALPFGRFDSVLRGWGVT